MVFTVCCGAIDPHHVDVVKRVVQRVFACLTVRLKTDLLGHDWNHHRVACLIDFTVGLFADSHQTHVEWAGDTPPHFLVFACAEDDFRLALRNLDVHDFSYEGSMVNVYWIWSPIAIGVDV